MIRFYGTVNNTSTAFPWTISKSKLDPQLACFARFLLCIIENCTCLRENLLWSCTGTIRISTQTKKTFICVTDFSQTVSCLCQWCSNLLLTGLLEGLVGLSLALKSVLMTSHKETGALNSPSLTLLLSEHLDSSTLESCVGEI